MNLIAAILHFGLALFFVVFFIRLNQAYPRHPLPGAELSVKDHTLDLETDVSGSLIINWTSTNVTTVPVTTLQIMLISFFFITGCFHLFYYMTNDEYERVIHRQNNFYRWIEYAITSTVMLYIMTLVTGTKDTGVYMMLVSSNVAMISLGQMVEDAVRTGGNWLLPMCVSFLLLLMEFSVIARNFWGRIGQISTFLKTQLQNPKVNSLYVPGWLKPMVIVLFLFYISFGLFSFYASYHNLDYELVETVYIILSFVSKATLGAFVGYGLGLRQEGLLTPSTSL